MLAFFRQGKNKRGNVPVEVENTIGKRLDKLEGDDFGLQAVLSQAEMLLTGKVVIRR